MIDAVYFRSAGEVTIERILRYPRHIYDFRHMRRVGLQIHMYLRSPTVQILSGAPGSQTPVERQIGATRSAYSP